jgi:cation diffusion facilitator CzcD-associated flavoprotein CzcO
MLINPVDRSGTIIQDSCDILVAAVGTQNTPLEPVIPGLSDFNGPVVHTGNW